MVVYFAIWGTSILDRRSLDLRLRPSKAEGKSECKRRSQGSLEEFGRINSYGDAEVREKRRAVVKAIEKALEGVEQVVGGRSRRGPIWSPPPQQPPKNLSQRR